LQRAQASGVLRQLGTSTGASLPYTYCRRTAQQTHLFIFKKIGYNLNLKGNKRKVLRKYDFKK
jgi:hypothetical protein